VGTRFGAKLPGPQPPQEYVDDLRASFSLQGIWVRQQCFLSTDRRMCADLRFRVWHPKATRITDALRRRERRATSSSEALPASHSALPPDLGKWEKTGLLVHGSATMRSRASTARVEGTVESSRECVMAFRQAAPYSGRPRPRPGVGATPWNGSFAPGVLLAALIVATLIEGLSIPSPRRRPGTPTRPRHRAIAEREELR
jgi:hypothetical protein